MKFEYFSNSHVLISKVFESQQINKSENKMEEQAATNDTAMIIVEQESEVSVEVSITWNLVGMNL